jgi:hypothetical protein
MKSHHLYLLAALCLIGSSALSQEEQKAVSLTGSIQSDVLIPQEDSKIGTGSYSDWGLTNTYAELHMMSKYVTAGTRFEYLDHPLPGFEKDFKGWGFPYFYATGKYKTAELTVGDFYEQFGSGFILRTYEERSLGIDNSLRGARLVVSPVTGVTFKALGGKQRRYWNHNHAWVYGADMELNVDQWFKTMQEHNTYLMLGGSFVSKHEDSEDIMVDATHKLNLPENVGSYDVRARLQHGNYSFLAEYAQKGQDPSYDNGYIYRKGSAALFSASYSKRGMSLLLQAKRSDDMSYRSRRSMTGTSSFINHLPAFTMQHTYALAALYPYATQPGGEWAYQAEAGYNFKKKTALGGKYGTNMKFNFSYIRSINKDIVDGGVKGSDGYTSSFFKWGNEVYYHDINVQLEKRLTENFKLNLMYMNQRYNKTVVEGEGGTIRSNIYIAEGKYHFNEKLTLRGEAQYLNTKNDQGDWLYGLLELSVLPSFMFTVSDMYNAGDTNIHYYMGSVTFTHGAHRLQVGYGRTRAGYNCSGGVCRYVPASKGVQASYNYNF